MSFVVHAERKRRKEKTGTFEKLIRETCGHAAIASELVDIHSDFLESQSDQAALDILSYMYTVPHQHEKSGDAILGFGARKGIPFGPGSLHDPMRARRVEYCQM